MQKQKLRLEELKVDSFVTTYGISRAETPKVIGASADHFAYNCQSVGGITWCDNPTGTRNHRQGPTPHPNDRRQTNTTGPAGDPWTAGCSVACIPPTFSDPNCCPSANLNDCPYPTIHGYNC